MSDASQPGSLAHRFRQSRFAFFRQLLESVPRPIRLLDIGGTEQFWEAMEFARESNVEITLCNVTPPPSAPDPRFRFVQADACDLGVFADQEYDVVFSNSVIEHVGDLSRCRAMAEEVQRVGKRYFVQTPNRNFPIDPHFPFPFFQFFPLTTRTYLLRTLPLAWVGRIKDPDQAREAAQSVNLLTEHEVRSLFPGCELHHERLLGMTKSFMAYSGWSNPTSPPKGQRNPACDA